MLFKDKLDMKKKPYKIPPMSQEESNIGMFYNKIICSSNMYTKLLSLKKVLQYVDHVHVFLTETCKPCGYFTDFSPLPLCRPEFVRYITYSPDLLPRNFKCSYFYHNYELTNENYNNSIRHSVISNICTNDAPRFIQCQLRLNKISTMVHFLSI